MRQWMLRVGLVMMAAGWVIEVAWSLERDAVLNVILSGGGIVMLILVFIDWLIEVVKEFVKR